MSSIKISHLDNLRLMIEALMKSDAFFGLFVESDPGMGKSTLISATLKRLKVRFVTIGAFSSPLHLFNTAAENAHDKNFVLVLDDVKGIIESPVGISILKALLSPATDSSVGGGSKKSKQGRRIVRWGTTTDRSLVKEFSYHGKVLVVSNTSPLKNSDGDAFMSRCLTYRMYFTLEERFQMLKRAATTPAQRAVYRFLDEHQDKIDPRAISLRTLHLGADLYRSKKGAWKRLLLLSLPKEQSNPLEVVKDLAKSQLPIEAQFVQFHKLTQRCRRSFFNYRKQLGLAKNGGGSRAA